MTSPQENQPPAQQQTTKQQQPKGHSDDSSTVPRAMDATLTVFRLTESALADAIVALGKEPKGLQESALIHVREAIAAYSLTPQQPKGGELRPIEEVIWNVIEVHNKNAPVQSASFAAVRYEQMLADSLLAALQPFLSPTPLRPTMEGGEQLKARAELLAEAHAHKDRLGTIDGFADGAFVEVIRMMHAEGRIVLRDGTLDDFIWYGLDHYAPTIAHWMTQPPLSPRPTPAEGELPV